MDFSTTHLSASEAAKRLGVSTKALRLYEQRGLVTPDRTAAGYRIYSPQAMKRASETVALRALGLSLAQVAHALEGEAQGLEPTLAAHAASLDSEIRSLVGAMDKVDALRADLIRAKGPANAEHRQLPSPHAKPDAGFELPWPWGGEWFEIPHMRPINYIIGPLGSGKTRLALRLSQTLPNAAFLGLERLEDASKALAALKADPALAARVETSLEWFKHEGANVSEALSVLLVGLETEGPSILVVDMVEQGLDEATQKALIACLRQRARAGKRPLFLMTRSSAILDLAAVGMDELILFCPANHSPPIRVAPYPGAPGYEAVVMCLASPAVRARTAGLIAWLPETA